MSTSLQAELAHAFDHWWASICASDLLRRRPGAPTLRISDDPDNLKTALIWPRERPEIEVFSGFLHDLQGDLDANEEAIVAACFRDLRFAPGSTATLQELSRCMLHLSLSFVLLHELCHILCGHADESRHTRGGLALDEVHLGLTPGGAGRMKRGDVSAAYYRELEADDTAVQWLIHAVPLEPLTSLLATTVARGRAGAPPRSMGRLRGSARVLGFRLLLVTLWLMIRLFERKRGPELRARSAAHPLPAARLLAAVATVLEEYAAVDGWRLDASGRKVQTLSDRHVSGIRGFLRDVLKPVLAAPWPGVVVDEGDDGFETSPVWIAKETGNLLLQRPPETEPGLELSRLERLRPRMLARLEAYRYFDFNG